MFKKNQNKEKAPFLVMLHHRSSHRRFSIRKKLFLEISQNPQENTCARDSFLTILKKRLWHRCFSVNFAIFLRTPFLQNTSGRLLLLSLTFSCNAVENKTRSRWRLKHMRFEPIICLRKNQNKEKIASLGTFSCNASLKQEF